MSFKNIIFYSFLSIIFYIIGLFNYLLFHTLIETFTVFIGIGMFLFAINKLQAQHGSNESFYVFLGLTFGGISIIDLIHAFVYKGMSIVPNMSSNQATQLWIIARFSESLVILFAILCFNKINKIKISSVIYMNILLILFSIISVFIYNFFPDCYIEGQGLSSFKIISEYIIIGILSLSLFFLYKKKHILDPVNFSFFNLAIIMTILSEFMFTFYFDVYGLANTLGHIFKLFAFILIYNSIFKNLFVSPYEKINIELSNSKLQIENELKETKENYKKIVENINDLITIFDEFGTILYVNNKSIEFWGLSPKQCLGKSAFDFIHSDDVNKTKLEFEKWKSNHSTNIFFENRTKNNIFLSWNIKMVKNILNQNIKFFSIARNVTDIKKYEKELKNKNFLIEQASLAKSLFLANMSHEIRTPMNGILGMAELLTLTELDKEQSEYVEDINTSANHLLGIINDILDLSKIESGKIDLVLQEFDLELLIDKIFSVINFTASKKKLDLIFNIEKEIPKYLISDSGKIRQVLLNLLSNAIKFTDFGSIVITIKKESETKDILELKFFVSDSGLGISKKSQLYLFQPFVQGDSSYTKKFQGTGLGLSISKRLVKILGGDISFETELNKGSTFFFTLPLKKSLNNEYCKEISNKYINSKINL